MNKIKSDMLLLGAFDESHRRFPEKNDDSRHVIGRFQEQRNHSTRSKFEPISGKVCFVRLCSGKEIAKTGGSNRINKLGGFSI